MEERPVMMNRAPTLHKHGIQSFKAIRSPGLSIKTNPIINAGFNLDYDGDTVGIHIPISKKAVNEAWGMLPSKNVFKHGENGIIQELSKDYLHGLYFLTKDGKNTRKKFKSISEASKDKTLDMDDVFTINGKVYTLGRIAVNKVLPPELRNYQDPLDKKRVRQVLGQVGKKHPNKFSQVINSFKDLGNKWGHERGTTLSIHDLKASTTKRDALFNSA